MKEKVNGILEPSEITPVGWFIWLYAISSIWHYTSSFDEIYYHWLHYDALVSPLIFVSLATAFIAACYPTNSKVLVLFAISHVLAVGLRMPRVADHLIMELLLNLSIVSCYCYQVFKKKSFGITSEDVFNFFSSVGRCLLIIMYFFGTFHKLNSGFMSIESSCAVPFMDGLLPEFIMQYSLTKWLAIYGTLIFEFLAMLMLFSSHTKYYGMLIGISFHIVVGISSIGSLAHFSAFSIALHSLFLPSYFGQRVYHDPLVPQFLKKADNFKIITILFVLLQVAFGLYMGFTKSIYLTNTLFSISSILFLWLVFKHGKMKKSDKAFRLSSSLIPVNIIPIWFFIHCSSPYIGLGTGGTLQMFSGLRTEGGVSNHYVIQQPLRLFSYQDKVVYIEEAEIETLKPLRDDGLGMTLFDFQRYFTTWSGIWVLPLKISIENESYLINSPATLKSFTEKFFTEQTWLEEYYLSFRIVDQVNPSRCRH